LKIFSNENGCDVCKILTSLKGEEVECKKSYKHDGETGNIKQHLQLKYGILLSNSIQIKNIKHILIK